MLHYIIQTIAFQLFFLIVYDLFLKKETFFNWNRVYLLVTALLSLVLPFIKIDSFKEVVTQDYIIALPEVILGNPTYTMTNSIVLDAIYLQSTPSIYSILFYSGLIITLGLFLFKLVKILFLVIKSPKSKSDKTLIINVVNSDVAFSFFKFIFLGDKINLDDRKVIIKHELIHVKERHTFDLLFFEVLKIVFWFNPLIYIYQNKIASLHEFIADAKAVKLDGKANYYQNLLSQVFETQNISFINTFFKQSLIKKRIVMLSKSKSKQINLLKYALLIPIVLGMLVYTSCEKVVSQEKSYESQNSILQNIENLKESIAAKGEMTQEEEKALKTLMMLVTKDGLNNPFFEDVVDRAEIPFGVIDQVPVYPGCENMDNKEQKMCMAKSISSHVGNMFNIKLADDLGLKGKQKIYVNFVIDKKGNIKDVKARAAHTGLENEAVRVIKAMPKMKPGEHDGKKVNVPYSLPIIFEVK